MPKDFEDWLKREDYGDPNQLRQCWDASRQAFVEQLVSHCLHNGEFESLFLSPSPSFSVEFTGLLDFIVETTGMSKQEMSALVDRIQESRQQEANHA